MRETLAGVDGLCLWTLGVIISWSSLCREVVVVMPSVSIDSLMLRMIDL